jgi:effector-binding domain-containing protein
MSSKINLSYSKTLRLNNVLIFEVAQTDDTNINLELNRIDNYIKSKGNQPVGPFVQYTALKSSDDGNVNLVIKLLRQSSNYINNVEYPYSMESVLRIIDCMYVRFTGEETKLSLAYDKINLAAFEEDIALKGDSYTIITGRVDDTIAADVFMEKKHG